MSTIETPKLKTGLQKIDDAAYHALHLCSKHALDTIAKHTPSHLRYERANPNTPTDAMRLGTALHTYVLEREHFEARHPIASRCSAALKSGPRKGECCTYDATHMHEGASFCGTHRPDGALPITNSITRDQAAQIASMNDAVKNNRAAASVLNAEGHNEAAIIWRRNVIGDGWEHPVTCKMKADIIRPAWQMVADIKTCESASQTEFERSIATFNYHRQAAFYQDGCAAVGIEIKHFVFICVEKAAPYGVAVYRLLDDAIQLGREENERLITTYAACERTNHWWGYDNEFKDVSLPAWAFRQRANALQN